MRNSQEEREQDTKNSPFINFLEILSSIFLFVAIIAIGVIAIAVATTILVEGTKAAWDSIQSLYHSLTG